MRSRIVHNKGFTLIEVIVSLLLVSMLSVAIFAGLATARGGMNDDVCEAIRTHGDPNAEITEEWRILNMSDMHINGYGQRVTYSQRLDDIRMRYGEGSEQYKNAKRVIEILAD